MSEVTNSRASGHWFGMGLAGELSEGQTLSCCHCYFTWVLEKGSGKQRGFCTNCMGYVCGPNCLECIPREQKIENIEAGKDPNAPNPIRIFVPEGIDTGG